MTRPATVCAAALLACVACTPTVEVATSEPIVLELNIRIEQEVRVKLDREIQELIGEERAAAISPRGVDEEAPPALVDARSISAAKRVGSVGERPDGYLGIATAAPAPTTVELVERVNESRRAEYARIAGEHETDRAAVEALAGIQRTRSAQPGEAVLGRDGLWRERQVD